MKTTLKTILAVICIAVISISATLIVSEKRVPRRVPGSKRPCTPDGVRGGGATTGVSRPRGKLMGR